MIRSSFSRFRRFPNATRATASVEFALLLPVLVLLLFGTIELGRLINDYHAVVKGVRDAARYLSRVDGISCPASVEASRVSEASYLAMAGQVTAPTTADGYRLPYWTDPSAVGVSVVCVDNNAGTYAGIYATSAEIPQITVTASVNFLRLFDDLIIAGDQTDAGGFGFQVSHTELHIGS